MNSLLLSRIAKDFLNYDPELVPSQQMYRLGWGRSTLGPHPRRSRTLNQKKPISRFASLNFLSAVLSELKDQLHSLFAEEPFASILLSSAPKLAPPRFLPPGSYNPARYFSKGSQDADKKKTPSPIPYLLTETNEFDRARPVPGNSILFRSLCKGKGVLKQSKQGLIYLDVDNRFISSLIPYLKAFGLVRPPYFNLFGSPEGAHIPVVPAREAELRYLESFPEISGEFSFEIQGLFSMEPAIWPEVEQVWFFKLHSPELEKLRRRHFLPATPGGHSFHIAVAIKPRTTRSEQPHPLPIMRINVGYLAA